MIYANIKPLKEDKAEFLQQRVAAQAAKGGETLRLAKFFFDKLFRAEVDADTKGAFWDGGMVSAAQSMHRYRDSKSSLRTILPDVCARIDSILAVANSTDAKAAVKDAFPGNLDAATFTAINTRYPELVADCTSDKMLLNKVSAEACGTDLWKWCNKGKRWIVNDTKLTLAADLFASIATKNPERVGWQFVGDV